MKTFWDVIVVGLGGVGSAAAYHLARNGQRVLGIDAFRPAHDRGSSHGQTRIIRQAYFEHPDYVPLLKTAYGLWRELEAEVGEKLFHVTGLLQLGPPDGVVVSGVMRSATLHSLPIECFDASQLRVRFPQFQTEDHWTGVLERNAGYLRVEASVLAHLRLAAKHGATLRHEVRVHSWEVNGDGVQVKTSLGSERAARLVIAAGPWANIVLANHNVKLQILRKYQHWYSPRTSGFDEHDFTPCFFYETSTGYFYGFPVRDHRGLKVARHSGGEPLPVVPDNYHPPDDQDRQLVESFLHRYLPGVGNEHTEQAGCYYTMTADENFIVDRLPGAPQVVVVAGLSGHGFKFTSVLGKIAAELTISGQTSFQINFLRWR